GQAQTAGYTITGVNSETGSTVGTVSLSSTNRRHTTSLRDSSSDVSSSDLSSTLSAASSASPFTDTINKATATVTITPYNVTYNGQAQTAGDTNSTGNNATHVEIGTVALTSTHTAAGTYATDSYSFTPGANYSSTLSAASSASEERRVGKEWTATLTITPYNVTYNGQAQTAGYTITGVNSETGSTVGTVTLTSTHTADGT